MIFASHDEAAARAASIVDFDASSSAASFGRARHPMALANFPRREARALRARTTGSSFPDAESGSVRADRAGLGAAVLPRDGTWKHPRVSELASFPPGETRLPARPAFRAARRRPE